MVLTLLVVIVIVNLSTSEKCFKLFFKMFMLFIT